MHHYSKTCITLVHHSILVSLVSFELKVLVLGFFEGSFYLYTFERKFLKCEVSLEGLFKKGISLEKCKGCLEPKVQEGELEP